MSVQHTQYLHRKKMLLHFMCKWGNLNAVRPEWDTASVALLVDFIQKGLTLIQQPLPTTTPTHVFFLSAFDNRTSVEKSPKAHTCLYTDTHHSAFKRLIIFKDFEQLRTPFSQPRFENLLWKWKKGNTECAYFLSVFKLVNFSYQRSLLQSQIHELARYVEPKPEFSMSRSWC